MITDEPTLADLTPLGRLHLHGADTASVNPLLQNRWVTIGQLQQAYQDWQDFRATGSLVTFAVYLDILGLGIRGVDKLLTAVNNWQAGNVFIAHAQDRAGAALTELTQAILSGEIAHGTQLESSGRFGKRHRLHEETSRLLYLRLARAGLLTLGDVVYNPATPAAVRFGEQVSEAEWEYLAFSVQFISRNVLALEGYLGRTPPVSRLGIEAASYDWDEHTVTVTAKDTVTYREMLNPFAARYPQQSYTPAYGDALQIVVARNHGRDCPACRRVLRGQEAMPGVVCDWYDYVTRYFQMGEQRPDNPWAESRRQDEFEVWPFGRSAAERLVRD